MAAHRTRSVTTTELNTENTKFDQLYDAYELFSSLSVNGVCGIVRDGDMKELIIRTRGEESTPRKKKSKIEGSSVQTRTIFTNLRVIRAVERSRNSYSNTKARLYVNIHPTVILSLGSAAPLFYDNVTDDFELPNDYRILKANTSKLVVTMDDNVIKYVVESDTSKNIRLSKAPTFKLVEVVELVRFLRELAVVSSLRKIRDKTDNFAELRQASVLILRTPAIHSLIPSVEIKKDLTSYVVMSEYQNTGETLKSQEFKQLGIEEKLEVIFQVFWALMVASETIGFTHGDSHFKNITFMRDDITRTYEHEGHVYVTRKMHASFIDFGNSSVKIIHPDLKRGPTRSSDIESIRTELTKNRIWDSSGYEGIFSDGGNVVDFNTIVKRFKFLV